MSKRSIRAERRRRQRSARRRGIIAAGAVAVILLGVLGIAAWNQLKPLVGQAVPELSRDHVQTGVDPGVYNSDPPTSGPHYAESLQAGFYHEQDLATLPEYPQGYLVHNLEHGYVIFWYNCAATGGQAACSTLKNEIRAVMDRFGGTKLIAFPWDSIDEPVVMTSWGQIQRFDQFNADIAANFVSRNRNQAPEPHAP